MESDSNANPYASPAVSSSAPTERLDSCPTLPIVFRPSWLTLAHVLPTGLAALLLTSIFARAYLNTFVNGSNSVAQLFHPFSVIAIVAILFGGFIAFACLTSVRNKVVVSDSSIEIFDFPRQSIPFRNIESWHHHPETGSVAIEQIGKKRLLFIDNRAMSRKKSRLLGGVLREKVGPPSSQKEKKGDH
jgi:hypothetical protein